MAASMWNIAVYRTNWTIPTLEHGVLFHSEQYLGPKPSVINGLQHDEGGTLPSLVHHILLSTPPLTSFQPTFLAESHPPSVATLVSFILPSPPPPKHIINLIVRSDNLLCLWSTCSPLAVTPISLSLMGRSVLA